MLVNTLNPLRGFLYMRAAITLLSATAVMVGVINLTASPAQAYNNWQMQSDQQTINQLSQEGVLNPNQAIAIDRKAYNRANGSWLQNRFSPMFSGGSYLGSNPLQGNYVAPIPMGQSFAQIHREDRQIDKLERDSVISKMRGHALKAELNSQANMYANRPGYMPQMGIYNGGYQQPMMNGYTPSIMNAYAPGMMPTNYNMYPAQGNSFFSNLQNRLHF